MDINRNHPDDKTYKVYTCTPKTLTKTHEVRKHRITLLDI